MKPIFISLKAFLAAACTFAQDHDQTAPYLDDLLLPATCSGCMFTGLINRKH